MISNKKWRVSIELEGDVKFITVWSGPVDELLDFLKDRFKSHIVSFLL